MMRFKILFSILIAIAILSSYSIVDNFITKPAESNMIDKKDFPDETILNSREPSSSSTDESTGKFDKQPILVIKTKTFNHNPL